MHTSTLVVNLYIQLETRAHGLAFAKATSILAVCNTKVKLITLYNFPVHIIVIATNRTTF